MHRYCTILGITLVLALMQNCTPLTENTELGDDLAFSGNYASTLGAGSAGASGELSASYAPTAVRPGDTVTINPSGGRPPYAYILALGKGKLSRNVYVAPASIDTTAIAVVDSLGKHVTLQFNVGSGGLTVAELPQGPLPGMPSGTTSPPGMTLPSGTTIPQLTPEQMLAAMIAGAAPSNPAATTMPNKSVVARNCRLSDVTYTVNIATAINYEWCLKLGRFANNDEAYNWYHGIKKGRIDPNMLPIALFQSPEFNQRYGSNSMKPEEFAILIVRLLLYREPTLAEVGQLAAVVNQQGQIGAYQAVMAQSEFYAVHPFLAQVRMMMEQ